MNYLRVLILPLWLATPAFAGDDQQQAIPATAQQQQFFTDQVRPILAQRCWECHGEDVQESGLRLDSRQNLLAGGSSGKALGNFAKPDESYLIQVLQHTGDVAMPPDEKLPGNEIAVINSWIGMGLPWPGDASGNEAPITWLEPSRVNRKSRYYCSLSLP